MMFYSPTTRGFYSEDTQNRPEDSIEIADEHYLYLFNEQSSGKVIEPDAQGYPIAVAPPGFTSDELIARAMMRINRAYEISVNAMTSGYPQAEIDSWSEQKAEAQAWLADNNVPTLWLDAASTARGITKLEFAMKVMDNANAFAVQHGQLTGKRQKLRDQILALGPNPTPEQLEAIQW